MNENREYKRTPVELAASFGIPDDDDSAIETTIINISAGGFCFSSTNDISKDSEINLAIELDNKETLKVTVRTIWSKRDEENDCFIIGVQIAESKGSDYEKFLHYYVEQVRQQKDTLNE